MTGHAISIHIASTGKPSFNGFQENGTGGLERIGGLLAS